MAAQQLARARKHPNYDAACFHTQQCAEKYLKAWLDHAELVVEKTHHLINLLNRILPVEPDLLVLADDLKVLNDYAVSTRYPGMTADKTEAKTAIRHCKTVRARVREALGLAA